MATRRQTSQELAPQLQVIATAAAERLRAQADGDPQREHEPRQALAEAASAAIAAGWPLGAIAEAERIGQARARDELGPEVLRRVERARRRKREADREYHDAVTRAVRLGLAHRDVADAAHVAHATIRAILARNTARSAEPPTPSSGTASAAADDDAHGSDGPEGSPE